jgi:hypothetical protein
MPYSGIFGVGTSTCMCPINSLNEVLSEMSSTWNPLNSKISDTSHTMRYEVDDAVQVVLTHHFPQ